MNGDIVRCNWCESVFVDTEITIRHGEECCPRCNESGCIMDMPGEMS